MLGKKNFLGNNTLNQQQICNTKCKIFKTQNRFNPTLTWRELVSSEFKGSVEDPCVQRSRRVKPERLLEDGPQVGHPLNRFLLKFRILARQFRHDFAVQSFLGLGIFGQSEGKKKLV